MKKIYPYIIVVLLVVIAIILYLNLHVSTVTAPVVASPVSTTQTPSTPTSQPVSLVAVVGMSKYTDANFGFSFWYPNTWQVTPPVNPPFGAQISGATVVATLGVQPIGQTYPSIIIKEAHSTNRSITDTGGAGPIGPITYFFDATTHLWMTTSAIADGATNVTKPANISVNTMGGLHMLSGTSRFDTSIIPLSADNFVVIGDGDGGAAKTLEKTVTATDLSVATPVSSTEQIQTIKAEAATLAAYKGN